jgi:hypothetical protein
MISVNAKPTIHDPAVGLRCGAGGVMTPPGPPAWCSAPLPRNGGCRAEESPFPLSSGSKSSMVRGFWQSLDFPGYFVYMYFVQVDPNWPSSNKGPSTRQQTVFAFRGQCNASVLVAPTAIVRRGKMEDHALTQAFWQASRKGVTPVSSWHRVVAHDEAKVQGISVEVPFASLSLLMAPRRRPTTRSLGSAVWHGLNEARVARDLGTVDGRGWQAKLLCLGH